MEHSPSGVPPQDAQQSSNWWEALLGFDQQAPSPNFAPANDVHAGLQGPNGGGMVHLASPFDGDAAAACAFDAGTDAAWGAAYEIMRTPEPVSDIGGPGGVGAEAAAATAGAEGARHTDQEGGGSNRNLDVQQLMGRGSAVGAGGKEGPAADCLSAAGADGDGRPAGIANAASSSKPSVTLPAQDRQYGSVREGIAAGLTWSAKLLRNYVKTNGTCSTAMHLLGLLQNGGMVAYELTPTTKRGRTEVCLALQFSGPLSSVAPVKFTSCASKEEEARGNVMAQFLQHCGITVPSDKDAAKPPTLSAVGCGMHGMQLRSSSGTNNNKRKSAEKHTCNKRGTKSRSNKNN